MPGVNRALALALDVARTPALARAVRKAPVPPEILTLIRIAAGSSEAIAAAVVVTSEEPDDIVAAARLFLQQCLFQVSRDHYRTLGVSPTASSETLAEHARWLMKWLHPDRDGANWDSALGQKVLSAWYELKTPERRAQYDRRMLAERQKRRVRPAAQRKKPTRQKWRLVLPWIAVQILNESERNKKRQVAVVVLACFFGLVVVLLSDQIILPLAAGLWGRPNP